MHGANNLFQIKDLIMTWKLPFPLPHPFHSSSSLQLRAHPLLNSKSHSPILGLGTAQSMGLFVFCHFPLLGFSQLRLVINRMFEFLWCFLIYNRKGFMTWKKRQLWKLNHFTKLRIKAWTLNMTPNNISIYLSALALTKTQSRLHQRILYLL